MKLKLKSASESHGSLIQSLMSPEISILIPLLILAIYTGIVNPAFFSLQNIQIILRYSAFIGALVIGQAFVIMTGEIDLSIGANSVFTSIVFGALAMQLHLPSALAIIGAILAGTLIGLLNAILSMWVGLNSWIATLSTQYVCLGLATVISKGQTIGGFSGGYQDFASARPLGLSWMLLIVWGLFLITEIVIRFTVVGRKIHAVGLNPEASRVVGVNVKSLKSICLIFSGAMAGVCGVLQTVSSLAASTTTGRGNEFPAIICCAIGGISTSGGKGTMLGALIGVVMYQMLKNCLQVLGLDNNFQLVITGIILLLAVGFDIIKTQMYTKVRK